MKQVRVIDAQGSLSHDIPLSEHAESLLNDSTGEEARGRPREVCKWVQTYPPNRSKICNFSPPKYCTISINSTRHTSDSQALVLCRIGPMCDQAGKLKNGSKIGCFTDHFSSSRPDWAQKSLKAAYS